MDKLSRNETLRNRARYADNYMDYKKVIVPRSFAKDYRPKNPMSGFPLQRNRNRVAFANR